MLKQRIGFIGAGNMATALGQGFVRAGLTKGVNLLAADPSETARSKFAQATGGQVCNDNIAVAAKSDVLFLAVKPQYMAAVAAPLAGKIPPPRSLSQLPPACVWRAWPAGWAKRCAWSG